ncbi:retrotransposon hot spot (RHS) protein, putative, partial [Trypanosoma cruzi]
MPPKRNRVQGGNARSRASAVPQGVRQRRARPESEDVTDQPAATHIRVEEARQPQWTMRSSVKDILLEGITLSTNMKLNDFLRNYVGGRAAADEDSNVTMQVFVQEPDAYVQDQQLLRRIFNLTEYQELEERKIQLEAIYKLHHEGVVSLEQWRDYEGKDTVAPLANEKLNRVLTQLLREEWWEEVERARREHQERFTPTTTIEDVLFKGRVRFMDIKLNDFLTMELEGKGILRANRNVLLEEFFKDPTKYIHDAGILGEIQATGAYARMEMTVREEMGLEEVVRRLCEDGVDFLEQWRDYEGKDTVTPLARRKLNGVLTQLLREERREAEERARREHQERFTPTTTIRIVLFKGRARVMDIKLNDFLTMELEGKGILRANRNVLLKGFFKNPTSYIRDAGILGEIQATDAYLSMERTVREEMDLEEAVRRLSENGVNSLAAWSLAAEEVKACVRDDTKISLNAALEETRNPTTSSAPENLEGFYDSVYNARWHHVVEVPGGEGTGMDVKEGEPPQPWTYRKAERTIEKDDGVEQSGAERLRLMVLTSDKAWPYTWAGSEHICDCCVNSEVERVWQFVKRDLTEWFSPHGRTVFSPKKRLLIGTPG